ncbi:hypothetical protein O1611_g2673 [Lasiodiplodia mahajangana]|uniref:Uncharacterized protein n=1 Tax=Lasiodiplodia mahajangana TaxID=1108764 RepID=A0ACC2JTV8_9PEZI|nr:hypothetical protein O1611_g2673 [Lasiodiplodia mahajangana]
MHFSFILAVVGFLVDVAIAATLTQVPNYENNATSKAQMWVYKPDNVVANPPLVVVIHSCQSTAQSYFQNSLIPWKQGSDKKGYITVWPSSPNSGTCWDVSSKRSLSHLGGGDSQAIANMILYAIKTYSVDATRVYVTGGSSGAMMSNVLAATYPELIKAVSLYSGVAAGCFSRASADQWKQVVLDMYPGYDGPRPKMQIWHGSADSTLAPQNYQEEIKQWTGVFNVSQTPTSTVQNFPKQGYTTSNYGDSVQGIYGQGVGHSVPANLTASEIWFGL